MHAASASAVIAAIATRTTNFLDNKSGLHERLSERSSHTIPGKPPGKARPGEQKPSEG